MLMVMVGVLWAVVVALVIAVWALARQVAVLLERLRLMGAPMIDGSPGIGTRCPRFDLTTLGGAGWVLGGVSERSTLLFFLSPTCPVCKQLLPVLRNIFFAEHDWLDVVFASDGEITQHQRLVATHDLGQFPYLLSTDLSRTFKVSQRPFAVLIGEDGLIRAKGPVSNREALDTLLSVEDLAARPVRSLPRSQPRVVRLSGF
jgi:methylamine dehydrogenase accessory protein MauD